MNVFGVVSRTLTGGIQTNSLYLFRGEVLLQYLFELTREFFLADISLYVRIYCRDPGAAIRLLD